MLAPEPFFEPRGTPFSEYHRIKALSELGYHIDLVTYPFGRDVTLRGLRIYRCPRPLCVRRVRIGPSASKILLDLSLAATAARLAHAGRYDAVHSHEEAGVLGLGLAEWLGVPHLYDMHSSLPQQLHNFGYDRFAVVQRLFERAETMMITRSHAVITICQELQDTVVALGAADRDVADRERDGGRHGRGSRRRRSRELRARYGIGAGATAGALHRHVRGLPGPRTAHRRRPLSSDTTHPRRASPRGGRHARPGRARAAARRQAQATIVIFTGQRPADEIPGFVAACDILVSPRTSGTNTPLKIYSYLRSGRPIVATRLRTHTQVLDSRTALLVLPRAEALAAGLARLIDAPHERAAAGRRGPGARRRTLQPRVVPRPDRRRLRAPPRPSRPGERGGPRFDGPVRVLVTGITGVHGRALSPLARRARAAGCAG